MKRSNMATTKTYLPPLVQSYDYSIKRLYKKKYQRFIFGYEKTVRIDRIEDWNEWEIRTDKMPDKIFVNGEEYSLLKIKK